ncbi:MAG: DUF3611 family protein [Cyanobacteria bacterium RM1_2_2]|nr:DUF3611 family protein [Cyanobacteria bacterium RM1_2_2]
MVNRFDSQSVPPAVRRVATAFRLVGWVSFWAQIVLAAISTIILIFAAGSFGRTPPVRQPGIPGTVPPVPTGSVTPGSGVGLLLAVLGLLALFGGAFWAFRYTRLSRRLKLSGAEDRPKRGEAVRQLYFGLSINMLGMLFTILGAQAIVGSLVAKAFSQGFGFLSGNFQGFITALDLFLVQANTNTILAHFIGVVSTLWLLRSVNRQ